MCAVCTGHLSLRFETLRTQEAKTGKQQNKKAQTTKQNNKTKTKTTSENIGVSSLYI